MNARLRAVDGLPPASAPDLPRLLAPFGIVGAAIARLLATRPEQLDDGAWEALLRWRSPVPALPFDQIERVLADRLPEPPERLFESINPRPLATGWAVQAHEARGRDGERLAIEVVRPDARRSLDEALERTADLDRLFERLGVVDTGGRRRLVDELGRALHAELDFDRQLRAMRRLLEIADRRGAFKALQPVDELCGGGLLVREHVDAVPLSELLAALDPERAERLAARRTDPELVAERLALAVTAQSLRWRFVQADLSPANILVLPGARVAYRSCAHVETLAGDTAQRLIEASLAIDDGQPERFFDALTETLVGDEETDLVRLRSTFLTGSAGPAAAGRTAGGPSAGGSSAGERSADERTAGDLLRIVAAADRNRFHVPRGIRAFCRSTATAERLTRMLGAGAHAERARGRLLGRLRIESLLEIAHPDSLQPALLDALKMARDAPRLVRRLLADVVGGQLVLRVRTVESEEDRRQGDARARLITTALLSVGLAFLLGASGDVRLLDRVPLAWLLWPPLVVTWVWTLVQWRNLR